MIFTGKNRKPIPILRIRQTPILQVPRVKYNMFDAIKPTNCGYCGGNK